MRTRLQREEGRKSAARRKATALERRVAELSDAAAGAKGARRGGAKGKRARRIKSKRGATAAREVTLGAFVGTAGAGG